MGNMIFQVERLIMIETVVILLLPNSVNPHHIHSRKRRFASLSKFVKKWTANENEATSEIITDDYVPIEPYVIPESEYLGRPGPTVAKLLRWDDRVEHGGPLVSRLVPLTRDIVEETDIVQSVLLSLVGMENILIHSGEEQDIDY